MKKFFPRGLMSALLLLISVHYAAAKPVDDSLIALGGIQPWHEFSEVVQVYGQPQHEKKLPHSSDDKIYGYGNWNGRDSYNLPYGFLVTETYRRGTMDKIEAIKEIFTCDPSIATPNGIRVGSTVEEVLAAYGANSQYERIVNNDPRYGVEPSTVFFYEGYWYRIGFGFDMNTNKITRIEVMRSQDFQYKLMAAQQQGKMLPF